MAQVKNFDMDTRVSPPSSDDASSKTIIKYMGEVSLQLSSMFYEIKFRLNLLIKGNFSIFLMEVRKAEPVAELKKTGTIVYADGTTWNPGSGEGLYRYGSDAAWHYLG